MSYEPPTLRYVGQLGADGSLPVVVCSCGCRSRVARNEAVGVNGKWARADHVGRLLDKMISPRQLALLLGSR